MKIRKLILRAKLEQIEKQNQNIFIFHCSANAAQWRLLKNFLYNVIYDTPRQAASAGAKRAQHYESSLTLSEAASSASLTEPATRQAAYWLRGFTCFQSTSFKKRQARSGHRSISGPKTSQFSKYLRKYAHCVPSENSMRSMTFKPKGCLFFFETLSHSVFETHKKNSVCLELVNKIESLEFNNNLILLYGQLNSTVLNHIDIKETLILDNRTTYQDFLLSMDSVSTALIDCLHYHIDEFCRMRPYFRGQPHSNVISSRLEEVTALRREAS
jgi:hypothetical protein